MNKLLDGIFINSIYFLIGSLVIYSLLTVINKRVKLYSVNIIIYFAEITSIISMYSLGLTLLISLLLGLLEITQFLLGLVFGEILNLDSLHYLSTTLILTLFCYFPDKMTSIPHIVLEKVMCSPPRLSILMPMLAKKINIRIIVYFSSLILLILSSIGSVQTNLLPQYLADNKNSNILAVLTFISIDNFLKEINVDKFNFKERIVKLFHNKIG